MRFSVAQIGLFFAKTIVFLVAEAVAIVLFTFVAFLALEVFAHSLAGFGVPLLPEGEEMLNSLAVIIGLATAPVLVQACFFPKQASPVLGVYAGVITTVAIWFGVTAAFQLFLGPVVVAVMEPSAVDFSKPESNPLISVEASERLKFYILAALALAALLGAAVTKGLMKDLFGKRRGGL